MRPAIGIIIAIATVVTTASAGFITGIEATIKGTFEPERSPSSQDHGHDYFAGVVDVLVGIGAVCPPADVPRKRLVSILEGFYREHPGELRQASSTVAIALTKRFPCEKS